MKLDTKLRTLGPVNCLAMKAAVAEATPEVWLADKFRQEAFDVHAQTQSINLLLADGWPEMKVEKRSGWSEFSGVALPMMRRIINDHYGAKGTVIRAIFAKLRAGGVIDEHYDMHPSFAVAHRIHVPLITNDDVDFFIAGENHHLKVGMAYEVNNLELHSVANRGAEDRVHFIFDYAPDDLPS